MNRRVLEKWDIGLTRNSILNCFSCCSEQGHYCSINYMKPDGSPLKICSKCLTIEYRYIKMPERSNRCKGCGAYSKSGMIMMDSIRIKNEDGTPKKICPACLETELSA